MALALCLHHARQGSFQREEEAVDNLGAACEESLRTIGVEAAEGLLVERGGLHESAGGELVDDELDKAHLLGVEAAVCEEDSEGGLGGAAVHADDAPHQVRQRGHLLHLKHTGEKALTFVLSDAE